MENVMSSSDLLRTRAAAEYLGLSVDAISKANKRGRLPHKDIYGVRLYLRRDLDNYRAETARMAVPVKETVVQ